MHMNSSIWLLTGHMKSFLLLLMPFLCLLGLGSFHLVPLSPPLLGACFVGLVYQGKDMVFRFIIEYRVVA